jgi:hypothetical protein
VCLNEIYKYDIYYMVSSRFANVVEGIMSLFRKMRTSSSKREMKTWFIRSISVDEYQVSKSCSDC